MQPRSAPRELYFYNDDKEMPIVIKPPPKPRKRMYESSQQYEKRVQEWEAHKPPKVDVDP
ncbi:hypothetical protein BU23DRAFT_555580 [Bimuria novae-zelandiae CBS 107.79]|uniref:Uncharacterized protein n=1 Tax=Bimuria novae-zelandiae CBS 107.79 TaxID=1447943 RepID=A0A6A5V2Q0_9PLEO|nr:hypothetical protein BU23DRAFT_555580 [Bimuria novae-zelandiae CBS 107.79]